MIKNQEIIDNLFEELVPASGKADNKAGELVRALCRIGYRYYNDGDIIGIGYGKETCNAAARFMGKRGCDEMARILGEMWGNGNESEYEDLLNELSEITVDYIKAHPELKNEPTEDMFDHFDKYEDYDDEDCDDEDEENIYRYYTW